MKGQMQACRKPENLKSCPCTYPSCERKGMCCECIRHHRERDQLPACFFTKDAERSYDRSVQAFVRSRKA